MNELIRETKIIKPVDHNTITENTFEVQVLARKATKLEAYVRRNNSQQKNYLGKLLLRNNDLWILKVQVNKSLPNGDYKLFVKVKNEVGEYITESVSFKINRAVNDDLYIDIENKKVTKKDNHDDVGKTKKDDDSYDDKNKQIKKTKIAELTKEERKLIEDRDADFDNDGLTNKEEERLGTNPFLADSDEDGFLDGDEIKNGYNPLKFSPGDKSDKMIFQDPREKGEVKEEFEVKEVELVKEGSPTLNKENKIRLAGKALPNTFINIYIYSSAPVIVTVKTNENGNWSYELDKDIEDGNHEAYVVMTDNTGKITAKSNPIRFIKTAQAITIEKQVSGNQIKSPIESNQRKSFVYLLLIAVAFSGIAIIIVGVITDYRANKKD